MSILLVVGRVREKLEELKNPPVFAMLFIYCFYVGLEPNFLSCYLSPKGLVSTGYF